LRESVRSTHEKNFFVVKIKLFIYLFIFEQHKKTRKSQEKPRDKKFYAEEKVKTCKYKKQSNQNVKQ
jgi:hypothetical protein